MPGVFLAASPLWDSWQALESAGRIEKPMTVMRRKGARKKRKMIAMLASNDVHALE